MASLKEQFAKKKLQKKLKQASPKELFDLGVEFYKKNQFDDAVKSFTQVISSKNVHNENLAKTFNSRGSCHRDLKNYKCALEDFNKAIALNPNDAVAYNNRGICYSLLKQNELALADYNKAIELNPNFAEAYNNRGNCYSNLKNYERALEDYHKAIASNPNYAGAYNNRGNYYKNLKNYERALEDYNKAIDLNPNFAESYNNRGLCYLALKNYEHALENYNKAIALNPNNAAAYNNRGVCYIDLKNYKCALKDFNKAIDLNPNFAEAYNNRGNCYLALKNYEYALKDYNKAIALNPNYDETYYNRGLYYNDLEQYELSLADFDKAIDFFDSSEAYIFYNQVAIVAKQYDKARYYINKAFENADSKELQHKDIYLQNIDNAQELDIKNQELEEKNKQLLEKEKELEDMMSMFAHKFRSPLDAILYNTTHENNPKLYAEYAQTMRGLLDIFSIISTDDSKLKEKIKTDSHGNGRLISLFSKTLNSLLVHLLSASGTEKIQQHYLAYAKAHGKIAESITYKEWYNDYFDLEHTLQTEWEQSYSNLLNEPAPLIERLHWLEEHFFKLELIGFNNDRIQFKEYSTTESFLMILLNEILINAFKYYFSETKQAVILEWSERDNYQVLTCRNPSIRKERLTLKGSGKGHTFLSALARKTDCQFNKPKPEDDFVLEYAIPNELLLSNSTGEK